MFTKAFQEGEAARRAGKPATANPYVAGTDWHAWWMVGWEELDRELCPPQPPTKAEPERRGTLF